VGTGARRTPSAPPRPRTSNRQERARGAMNRISGRTSRIYDCGEIWGDDHLEAVS
jgi:hypothetical protein